MPLDTILSLLFPLLGSLFVIALAYFGTKWLAGRYAGPRSGRYMKVIERLPVAQDKSVVLIGAGKRVYMLAVSAKEIVPIGEMGEEELIPMAPDEGQKQDFYTVLSALLKKNKGRGDPGGKDGAP